MIHYKNVDKTGVIFCTTSLPSLAKWRKRLKKYFLFLPFAFDFTSPQSFCGAVMFHKHQFCRIEIRRNISVSSNSTLKMSKLQKHAELTLNCDADGRWLTGLTVEYFQFSAEKLYTFNKSKNKSRSVKSQRKCLKNYVLFTFVYFSQLSRNSPQKWEISYKSEFPRRIYEFFTVRIFKSLKNHLG